MPTDASTTADTTSTTDTTDTAAADKATTDTKPAADATSTESKTPEQLAADVEKWKAMSRKHEAESKALADKAKKFDEIENANKTEAQRLQDRAEVAEKSLAEEKLGRIKAEVASAKGITGEGLSFLSGTSKEELEASADALIAFRGAAPKPDFGAGDTRGGTVTGKNDFETKIAEATKVGNIQLAIRLKEAQHAEANKKK